MALRLFMLSGCTLAALALGASRPAFAQEVPAGGQADALDEGAIIVTARRQNESAQKTPVAITVLNEALLDRYAVKGVASIASITPGLFTGEASGSVGGSIALRGIGSGDSQPFIDQAISLNVDGVPISTAQLLRAAQLDLKQIEILRGPQALFFGKNSPGGIISLVSADPGSSLEAMVRGGYEFNAAERYGEGMLSMPLGETLGLRVAGRYSKMDGYIDVDSPATTGFTPASIKHFPNQEEVFLRGTLAFKPVNGFSMKLKTTYTDTKINGGPSYFSDVTACPYGVPQGAVDLASNCANDGRILTSQLSPAFLALDPYMGTNGNGFRNNSQLLVTLTNEFDLTDQLNLTTVTGYYRIRESLASNGGYGISSVNGFDVLFNSDQITQELRLRSRLDGPLNFLVGAFYEARKLYTRTFIGTPITLGRLPVESTNQRQESVSFFGQALLRPAPQWEITLGGRYTRETKNLLDYTVTPAGGAPVDVTRLAAYPGNPTPRLTFNNFSPEATVSYRPGEDLMVFASYKRGFKSGGFDAGYTAAAILANPARDQTFDPEKVEGAELGLKSQFWNRQLTANLTGYWYEYKNLQVSVFDTTARAFTTQNAAKARIKGIEAELRYRPAAVPGLSLNASAAYNDSRFLEYLGGCYAGQTVALGCNQVLNSASGAFTSQNLAGKRLRKAPVFTANFSTYYETPLTAGLMLSLSGEAAYSDGYDTGTGYQPLAYQPSFTKYNATLRLFADNKRWELALIGKNLSNVRNLIAGIDRTGTGTRAANGTTTPMCATISSTGCSKLADILGTPALPRSVAAQFTLRY